MSLKTLDLVRGDQVQLLDFGQTDLAYCRRLFALGVVRGVVAKVIRRAPLGCPIQLNIRGTDIMLREKEASALVWERV